MPKGWQRPVAGPKVALIAVAVAMATGALGGVSRARAADLSDAFDDPKLSRELPPTPPPVARAPSPPVAVVPPKPVARPATVAPGKPPPGVVAPVKPAPPPVVVAPVKPAPPTPAPPVMAAPARPVVPAPVQPPSFATQPAPPAAVVPPKPAQPAPPPANLPPPAAPVAAAVVPPPVAAPAPAVVPPAVAAPAPAVVPPAVAAPVAAVAPRPPVAALAPAVAPRPPVAAPAPVVAAPPAAVTATPVAAAPPATPAPAAEPSPEVASAHGANNVDLAAKARPPEPALPSSSGPWPYHPRLKLAYRWFSFSRMPASGSTGAASSETFESLSLDAYPTSTYLRVGFSSQFGWESGQFQRTGDYFLAESVSTGFQLPGRFTPFLEGLAGAGYMRRMDAGSSSPTLYWQLGVDAGVEVYFAKRAYVSVAFGFLRPGNLFLQQKNLSGIDADTWSLKVGLGI